MLLTESMKQTLYKMRCILLLLCFISAISKCEEVFISSTSTPSTEYQRLTNILTSLKENIELQSTIRETNHRLENIEKQSNEIARQLEKLEQKLTSERTNSIRIAITEDIDQRLKTLEQQFSKQKNVEETFSSNLPKTTTIPEDCLQVKERGNNASGIFLIKPKFANTPFLVVCDMTTKGGGWILLLNRFDGSVDFYLPWQSYKNGFGNLAGEFWLGLGSLHQLSGYQVNELLVELVGSDNNEVYAHYKQFSVGSESEGYSLKTLGGFSGTADDSLSSHAGLKFTTKDKDQDTSPTNCAESFSGAWWYHKCHISQLTGLYKETTNKYKGLRWGERYFLKKAKMLIRLQHDSALSL